jgi:hypothetical protein
MKISEFKKLPKRTDAFSTWRWKQRVETSFGTFGVEFLTDDESSPDGEDSPDDEMLRLGEDLVRYAKSHSEYIREVIYGSYQCCVTEFDPDWLESFEVPSDLKPGQIRKYCDPTLQLYRCPTVGYEGPPFECSVIVRPQWEQEHGLSLQFCDGAIVTVNQNPFKIVKGVLKEQ